jgi:uncharacterized protein YjbI with pentapeptide repeats
MHDEAFVAQCLKHVLDANDQYVETQGKDGVPLDLSGKSLKCVDFSGADLEGSTFIGTNLTKSHFKRADMSGSDVTDTKFDGVNLFEADLDGAVAPTDLVDRS